MSFPRFEFLLRSLAYDAGITMTRTSGGKKVSLSLGDKGEERFANITFVFEANWVIIAATFDDSGASLNTN